LGLGRSSSASPQLAILVNFVPLESSKGRLKQRSEAATDWPWHLVSWRFPAPLVEAVELAARKAETARRSVKMIISNSKHFGMFLPWKTASQIMVERLVPYNESPYSRFFYFNEHLNRVVHQHITVLHACRKAKKNIFSGDLCETLTTALIPASDSCKRTFGNSPARISPSVGFGI
jgi:hypothetical protein